VFPPPLSEVPAPLGSDSVAAFLHQFNAVEQQVIVEILIQVEQTVQIGLVSTSPLSYRNLARSSIGRITIGGSGSSVNNLKTLQIIQLNSYFGSFSHFFVEIEHTMSRVTDLQDDNIFIHLQEIFIVLRPMENTPSMPIFTVELKIVEGGFVFLFGGDHKIRATPC
jgi:hypothetical protein